MQFMRAMYMQQLRGLRPALAGISTMPIGLSAIVSSIVISRIVGRTGVRSLQTFDAAMCINALIMLSTADGATDY
jgi:hypothetical protein